MFYLFINFLLILFVFVASKAFILLLTWRDMVEDEIKKGFVWYALRVSFWIMILFLIIALGDIFGILPLNFNYFYFSVFLPITFVLSIIHLFKYKQKTFAILSLVITSIPLAMILIMGIAM